MFLFLNRVILLKCRIDVACLSTTYPAEVTHCSSLQRVDIDKLPTVKLYAGDFHIMLRLKGPTEPSYGKNINYII